MLMLVLVFIFLLRRRNMCRSGMMTKPIREDLGDIYCGLQGMFDSRSYDGVVSEILGKGPNPA